MQHLKPMLTFDMEDKNGIKHLIYDLKESLTDVCPYATMTE